MARGVCTKCQACKLSIQRRAFLIATDHAFPNTALAHVLSATFGRRNDSIPCSAFSSLQPVVSPSTLYAQDCYQYCQPGAKSLCARASLSPEQGCTQRCIASQNLSLHSIVVVWLKYKCRQFKSSEAVLAACASVKSHYLDVPPQWFVTCVPLNSIPTCITKRSVDYMRF
jgi:hypothetical protein